MVARQEGISLPMYEIGLPHASLREEIDLALSGNHDYLNIFHTLLPRIEGRHTTNSWIEFGTSTQSQDGVVVGKYGVREITTDHRIHVGYRIRHPLPPEDNIRENIVFDPNGGNIEILEIIRNERESPTEHTVFAFDTDSHGRTDIALIVGELPSFGDFDFSSLLYGLASNHNNIKLPVQVGMKKILNFDTAKIRFP